MCRKSLQHKNDWWEWIFIFAALKCAFCLSRENNNNNKRSDYNYFGAKKCDHCSFGCRLSRVIQTLILEKICCRNFSCNFLMLWKFWKITLTSGVLERRLKCQRQTIPHYLRGRSRLTIYPSVLCWTDPWNHQCVILTLSHLVKAKQTAEGAKHRHLPPE